MICRATFIDKTVSTEGMSLISLHEIFKLKNYQNHLLLFKSSSPKMLFI